MDVEIIQELFFKFYSGFQNENLKGRYFSFEDIDLELKKLETSFSIDEIGKSFLKVPIKSVRIGNGPIKILGWSQMHGNETTTTKGLFDLFNLFRKENTPLEIGEILKHFTLLFIPMLNPDGASRYTRENVNDVDLNRDAHERKEPESRVLRLCFENFQPDFCFNLHDQRTIFGVGDSDRPATLSFLAPSLDEKRSVTPEREKAMKIIAAMNAQLQNVIFGQVGRFDDAFNINCTGDSFQSLKVPTILFECGHFPGDYAREKTRQFFAFSVLVALGSIASGAYEQYSVKDYEKIPPNTKNFYDFILRRGKVRGQEVDVAIQFSEEIKAGKVVFIPKVQMMAPLLSFFGHEEIDCHGKQLLKMSGEELCENDIVHLILLNDEKLLIKTQDI